MNEHLEGPVEVPATTSTSTDDDSIDNQILVGLPHERVTVFVSSTLGELSAERQVAKSIIGEDLDLIPVLFEAGARPYPPRSVYRDYLKQSEIMVAIYWNSYGWVAPDMEISGIHDELLLAKELDKPLLIYVKRSENRKPKLQAMIDEVSAASTYAAFESAEELGRLLKRDLARLLSEHFMFRGHEGNIGDGDPYPTPPDLLRGLQEEMSLRNVVPRVDILEEIISQLDGVNRLLLVGPPGAGKTYLLGILGERTDGVYVSLSNQTTQQVMQHLTNRLRAIRGTTPKRLAGEADARAALQAELAAFSSVLLIDHADQNPEAASALMGLSTFQSKLVLTNRVHSPRIFGDVRSYEVPPFTPEEVQAYLDLKEIRLAPGEVEALTRASAGNPLYLYYFSTEQVSPLPQGLTDYQRALYSRLSDHPRHALNLIAVCLQPLQARDLHAVLTEDGTVSGPPTVTQSVVADLGALVRRSEGGYEGGYIVFHPYFREFVLAFLEQEALLEDYHLQLANQAVARNWTLPAAYHLNKAKDPRERDFLPRGAFVAKLHGSWQISEDLTRRLIELAADGDDVGLLLNSKMLLSELLMNMGRHDEARSETDEAIILAKETNRQEELVALELWSATLLVDDNRANEAVEQLERTLAKHGDEVSHLTAGILINLSYAYIHTYQWQRGAEVAERARSIFLEIGLEDAAYSCLINLCGCLLEIGREVRAIGLLQQLLERARSRRQPREEAGALNLLAKASRLKGQPQEARDFSLEAIRIWQRLGVVEKVVQNLSNLGNAFKDMEQYDRADEAYLEALKLATEQDLNRERGHAVELLSTLRMDQGRTAEALSLAEEALECHRLGQDPLRIASTLVKLGRAHQAEDQMEEAQEHFVEGAEAFARINEWEDAAAAFLSAATIALQQDQGEAEALVRRGIEAALRHGDAMQVLEFCSVGREPTASAPYLEALPRLLAADVVPRLDLFLTNLAIHAKALPAEQRLELLNSTAEELFDHVEGSKNPSVLGGLGAALMQTGESIPETTLDFIRDRLHNTENVYFRTYQPDASIWTIGLDKNRATIVQIDILSRDSFQSRFGLALVLLLVANRQRLTEAIEELGRIESRELRFILATYSAFESNVLQGRGSPFEEPLSPERPAHFVGTCDGAGNQEPTMWVISHDELGRWSDVTTDASSPTARVVAGMLLMNLLSFFTESGDSVAEARSVVVAAVEDAFS